MKRSVTFLVLLLAAVFSVSSARVIPLDSDFYDNIDSLYAICGFVRPSSIRPWTDTEARAALSRIEKEGLSGAALRLYTLLEEEIDYTGRIRIDDSTSLDIGADLALEGYYHSNYSDQYSDEVSLDFVTDSDWIRSYPERKPMLKLNLELEMKDFFYTYMDIQYGWGRISTKDKFDSFSADQISVDPESGDKWIAAYKLPNDEEHQLIWSSQYARQFASNVMLDFPDLEFETPKRAILSLAGNNWNMIMGRDRIEVGNSNIGNLLVDDHFDYNEFLNISFSSERFKYDLLYIFLNTLLADHEIEADSIKMYMIHMLEFTPADRFSLLVSENVMSQQKKIDPLYLNPAFFYHNINNRGMFNALFYVQLNYMPVKGLELYGQFALDQARAPNEGDEQSDAWGIAGGLKYTTSRNSLVLNGFAEFAYTTPLLYRRDVVDFVKVSRYTHNPSDYDIADDFGYGRVLFFDYIGFPYGGDCMVAKTGLSLLLPGILEGRFSLEAQEHGDMNIFKSHNVDGNNNDDANYGKKAPSGDVTTRSLTASLSFSFDCSRFFGYPKVKLEAEYDFIGIWDYTKASKAYSDFRGDNQVTLSVQLGL